MPWSIWYTHTSRYISILCAMHHLCSHVYTHVKKQLIHTNSIYTMFILTNHIPNLEIPAFLTDSPLFRPSGPTKNTWPNPRRPDDKRVVCDNDFHGTCLIEFGDFFSKMHRDLFVFFHQNKKTGGETKKTKTHMKGTTPEILNNCSFHPFFRH